MRKIFASILVLAMAITCFSMVAFAAPTTEIYFGVDGDTAVNATGDTYTTDIYYIGRDVTYIEEDLAEDVEGGYYIDSFEVVVGVENGTISVAHAGDISPLTNYSSKETLAYGTSADSLIAKGAFKIGTVTVTKGTEATTTVTLNNAKTGYFEGTYVPTTSTLTITWPAAKTDTVVTATGAPSTTTAVGADGVEYKNIWTCEYAITTAGNKTITAASLVFDATNPLVGDHDPITINNLNWTGGGNVNFSFAVVGAPVGATATVSLTQN